MRTFIVMWLALSAVAAIAFVFGSGVGFRRGFAEAIQQMAARPVRRGDAAFDAHREVRLPEDVRGAR